MPKLPTYEELFESDSGSVATLRLPSFDEIMGSQGDTSRSILPSFDEVMRTDFPLQAAHEPFRAVQAEPQGYRAVEAVMGRQFPRERQDDGLLAKAQEWIAPVPLEDRGGLAVVRNLGADKVIGGIVGAFAEAGYNVLGALTAKGVAEQAAAARKILETAKSFAEFPVIQLKNAAIMSGLGPDGWNPLAEIAQRKLSGDPMPLMELREKYPTFAQAAEELAAFPAGPAMALSVVRGLAKGKPVDVAKEAERAGFGSSMPEKVAVRAEEQAAGPRDVTSEPTRAGIERTIAEAENAIERKTSPEFLQQVREAFYEKYPDADVESGQLYLNHLTETAEAYYKTGKFKTFGQRPITAETKGLAESGVAKEPWEMTEQEFYKTAPIESVVKSEDGRLFSGQTHADAFDLGRSSGASFADNPDVGWRVGKDVVLERLGDSKIKNLYQEIVARHNYTAKVAKPVPGQKALADARGAKKAIEAARTAAAAPKASPAKAVQEIVEGRAESSLGTKEFKKQMIVRLDEAIANAKNETPDLRMARERSREMPTRMAIETEIAQYKKDIANNPVKGWDSRTSRLNDLERRLADYEKSEQYVTQNKAEYETLREPFGTVTIEIPGDGTFTIENTVESLSKVKKSVQGLRDATGEVKPFSSRVREGTPHELKYTFDVGKEATNIPIPKSPRPAGKMDMVGITGASKYVTNGHLMVEKALIPESAIGRIGIEATGAGRTATSKEVADLAKKTIKKSDIILEEVGRTPREGVGNMAIFYDGKQSIEFNAQYIDWLHRNVKDFRLGVVKGAEPTAGAIVLSGNRPVGVVMPMRSPETPAYKITPLGKVTPEQAGREVLTPGKSEMAGGLGAVSPFRKAQEVFNTKFREARRKRNRAVEQETPTNPAHISGDISDAPSMVIERQPKDIGISSQIRTPSNLLGVGTERAPYGVMAKAAKEAQLLTERDIMVEAGRRGERMEAAIHKIEKQSWGKKGETAYDHIVDPSRDAELSPQSLEGVKGIRAMMKEDKAEVVRIKREKLEPSISKIVEREYRAETGNKRKKLKADSPERAEIAKRIKDRLQEMVPDEWGIENYLPQMHPGNYQVFAEIGGQKRFVGAARTPMDAISTAMEHWGDHPELTPEAYHTTRRVFRGFDVLRTSRKNFYRVINKIADQAEIEGSTEGIRAAMRGVLGSREGRQKYAGFLQSRRGYGGYTKDLPKVLAVYNQQFVRWKNLSKIVAPMETAISKIKAEGRPNTAEAIKADFAYLWGESPSKASRLFDQSIQNMPYLRDYIRPMALERWSGYVKGGVVNLFLKFNPRFHALNRLQTFQTLSPLIKRDVVFYKSAEGQVALDRHGIRHLTGGKIMEGGRSYTSPQFREKFKGLAPETFNQELAWATFYKEAIDKGMPDKAAADYAFVKGNVQSQFLPLKTDTPPLTRGPFTSTMFQFRRFQIKDLELGYNLIADRKFPGFAKWLGAKVLFGGAKVFTKPLVGTGVGYLSWKAYKAIYDETVEEAKQLGASEEVAQFAGEEVANAIAFGLPGLIGLDMSYSFNLIDSPYGKSVPEKIGNLLLGPVGQTAVSIGSAIADTKGDEPSAMKRVVHEIGERVPALRFIDALRALGHKLESGQYEFRDQSGRLKYRADLKDVVVKALGGRSTREGEMALMLDALTEVASKYDKKLDEIVAAERNNEDWEKLQNDWNEMWPEFQISNDALSTRSEARSSGLKLDRAKRSLKQAGSVFRESGKFELTK